jgi:hypothetical protein
MQGRWTPDQQRTASALRGIRGTSENLGVLSFRDKADISQPRTPVKSVVNDPERAWLYDWFRIRLLSLMKQTSFIGRMGHLGKSA